MSLDDDDDKKNVPRLPRIFIFESGWTVTRKIGSERELCYMMAPGKDYYHRLADGELYLQNAEVKLCLPCAARRGLLSYDPKSLRDPIPGMNVAIDELLEGFDVVVREDTGPSN